MDCESLNKEKNYNLKEKEEEEGKKDLYTITIIRRFELKVIFVCERVCVFREYLYVDVWQL